MELYLTEHGYMQSGPRMLPESTRAAYLTQSFDRALAHPRVRQLLQYLLTAPPPRQDLFPTQIINHDGTPTDSFGALADWSALNAREPRRRVSASLLTCARRRRRGATRPPRGARGSRARAAPGGEQRAQQRRARSARR